MLATNVSEAHTTEEKLRWAFRLYDKDSSGRPCHMCFNFVPPILFIVGAIDVHEMIEIVGNLYEMEGVSKVSEDDDDIDREYIGHRTRHRREPPRHSAC